MYAARLVAIISLAAAVALPAFAQSFEYERRDSGILNELYAREPEPLDVFARGEIADALFARGSKPSPQASKPKNNGPPSKPGRPSGPQKPAPQASKPKKTRALDELAALLAREDIADALFARGAPKLLPAKPNTAGSTYRPTQPRPPLGVKPSKRPHRRSEDDGDSGVFSI